VAGTVVRVVRIEARLVEEVERVRPGRVLRADDGLPRGLVRVVQAGRPGLRVRRVALTLADGVVIDRREVGTVLLQPPQDRIVHVGARRVIASRGEFAGREILHMDATGYAPWTGRGVDDVTATGMRAGYGVVAVDPAVIPLGSRLYIEGYGVAIAGDTGGAIKGYRIDLGFDTAREAIRFGRRPVRVYILSTPARSGAAR
jgi:3D (Asp-Asp-Asp) domain-containing protein